MVHARTTNTHANYDLCVFYKKGKRDARWSAICARASKRREK